MSSSLNETILAVLIERKRPMKIQVLYDQGTACFPEDGMIFQPPCYFGAIDGVTGVYLPREGPRLFAGRTGGQLASHVLSHSFSDANPGESLKDILRKANSVIREISKTSGLTLQEPGLLPSAAFVAARINTRIHILQGGDSLAVWQMKDGTIEGTPNLAFTHVEELLRIIAELMEKYGGNRQKMWEEFRPILIEKRRADINTEQGGFALLNGQPEFERFWQKFTLPREEMALLVLFSDGLVPFEWTKNELALAGEIIRLYKKGGLQSVLEATRKIAEQKRSSSHEDYAEATAIAIEF